MTKVPNQWRLVRPCPSAVHSLYSGPLKPMISTELSFKNYFNKCTFVIYDKVKTKSQVLKKYMQHQGLLGRVGGACNTMVGVRLCARCRSLFLESDFHLKRATLFGHDHDALLRVIMVIFSLLEGVLCAFQPFWTRL